MFHDGAKPYNAKSMGKQLILQNSNKFRGNEDWPKFEV